VRRALKAIAFATAALLAAVAFFVAFTLPRRAATITTPLPPTIALGAYHVHSSRSDGTGTVDDIAAAAQRAGLQFVIVTDHGDGTRPIDPPAYRHGVLCLDGAEISSFDGHIVALDLRQASPYPLAGEGRDVVEDIQRLGGRAVLAHPDSPKEALRWRGGNVPFDGIEWVNADSEWRDDTPGRLAAVFARALVRPAESIVSLFARPTRTFQRWDTALRARPVFGLAAVDAHANIAWVENEEPRQHRTALRRPSYESMFRVLSQAVMLDQPLSGDAAADATRVWNAIAAGRTYSVTRAIAGAAALTFEAQRDGEVVRIGGTLGIGPASPSVRAAVAGADIARVTLLRDGQLVASGRGSVAIANAGPGAYRVEVFYPGQDFPWLVSSAIRVQRDGVMGPGGGGASAAASAGKTLAVGPTTPRHTEHDPSSTAAFELVENGVHFTFRLGAGAPAGQWAAVTSDLGTDAGVERISFSARASRPLRLTLQVRLPGRNNARWRRSFYVDETARPYSFLLQDFEPVEGSSTLRPIAARLHAVLVVAETLNTAPGTDAGVWITGMQLGLGADDR
jgi:hypothetical protein